MALYTSLTGLNGANTDLSVIANNIANVGSTGFKKSRVDFADVFASSAAQDPRKVAGIGTRAIGTRQLFTQGPLQQTGAVLDLAITGEGFFLTQDASGERTLTRNGGFGTDAARFVVDERGARVLGLPVANDGSIISSGTAALAPIQIPDTNGVASPTQTLDLALTLPDGAPVLTPTPTFDPADPATYSVATSTTVFDAGGAPREAKLYYVRVGTPAAGWDVRAVVDGAELVPAAGSQLTFDPATGALTSGGTLAFAYPAGGPSATLTLAHAPGTRVLARPFAVEAVDRDGGPPARLDNVAIDTKGVVRATYSDGTARAVGRIALATVREPGGLRQLGAARYSTTGGSGPLSVGAPGESGLGSVNSGTLERSNVELTDELVNLIVAQRAFQANSKAIETDQTMIQSILQLRG